MDMREQAERGTGRRHVFAAPYDGAGRPADGGRGRADEGEDVEVLELELGAAPAMVARGAIADAQAKMVLQRAERHGLPA
jgi:hypothetical protein